MPDQIRGYLLSPQQRRSWLLQQEDSSAFHSQCAVLLEGRLERARLKRAVELAMDKHEILRTTFQRRPGIVFPLQVIDRACAPGWREVDLRKLSARKQQVAIGDIFHEERVSPLNIDRGPLLRLVLAALSAHKHLLTINLPSLCADARSLNRLLSEIAHFYETGDREDGVDEEAIQYAHFSEWQNDLLASPDDDDGKRYWRKRNSSPHSDLRLPLEERAKEEEGFEPGILALEVDPSTVAEIETAARKYDTSVEFFLLACWHILLRRLTGQELIVGYLSDGRSVEGLDQILGLFAKWIPISCDLDGGAEFREVLQSISNTVRLAQNWQDYYIWGEECGANAGGPDYPSVGFEFEQMPGEWRVGGLRFSQVERYVCFDRFNVKLSCIRKGASLVSEFHFNRRAVPIPAIGRLAGQFHRLLKSASGNPEIATDRLEICSDIERHELLVELNDTKTDYAGERVPRLIEQQAMRTPDCQAVVYEDRYLTYAELNRRADCLARFLQKEGVGPDVPVAIFLTRSIELVVGILGVLKAGGAYLPLDPTTPQERIAHILEDARVSLLLTEEGSECLVAKSGMRMVRLDEDWEVIDHGNQKPFPIQTRPDHLAYVIYTSGSTGRPKGVMISHRGLANYLNWCMSAYDVGENTTAPVYSSIEFDLTVTSFFAPLLTGGSIAIVAEATGGEELKRVLSEGKDFGLFKTTPSHLNALEHWMAGASDWAGRMKVLVVGGEMLFGKSLTMWLAHGARVFNEYGPTETVVGCCFYRVPAEGEPLGAVPIGRPVSNTEVYLLKERLSLAPAGAPGELHIGGFGLARGYLNLPALTAEKFIPNPFTGELGARLFKTGDLTRYLPNGQLGFLGRLDHQVKVRGFRVELGDVENALIQHPAVEETVVVLQEDISGTRRLVAYFVTKQYPAPSSNELQQFLRRKIPVYMIPSLFVRLKELPLTAHGKIHRQALPIPSDSEDGSDRRLVAPRTPVEEIIAGIWVEVLSVKEVGVNDDFFELGGHSLLATLVVSRLRQVFGLDAAVNILFESPTIAELARIIGENSQAGDVRADLPTPSELIPGSKDIAEHLEELALLSQEEATIRLKVESKAPPEGN